MKHPHRLPLALLVYSMLAVVLFPVYKWQLNLDATAYLSLIKKVAAGDFQAAINGYWSPLQCWLAAPLYKAGLNVSSAFRIIGLLAGAGILVMISRLLRKVDISDQVKTAVLFTCILFILSYAYYKLSPDLLFCLPVLLYVDLITNPGFFQSKASNIACGIIGCLSYFAKTYGFTFFLLHFVLVQVILFFDTSHNNRTRLLIRNLVLGIGSFLLLASPWLYALYDKYHMITFGYSGKLNLLWQLSVLDNSADALVAVSPSPHNTFWEDPFFNPYKYKPYTPYFSAPILKQHMHVVLGNINTMLTSLVSFSLLSGGIVFGLVMYAFQTRKTQYMLMLLTMLVFPLGYLLVAMETRYLYLINFLLIITGSLLISKALQATAIRKKLQTLCWYLFFGSFLFHPLLTLWTTRIGDPDLFDTARELNAKHVHGRFAANSFGYYGRISKISFLTGDTLYRYNREPRSWEETLAACRTAGINYYIYICSSPVDTEVFKTTVLYKSALALQEVHTKYDNLLVLKLKE